MTPDDTYQLLEDLQKQNEGMKRELEQALQQLRELQTQQQSYTQLSYQLLNERSLIGLRNLGYICYISFAPIRLFVRLLRKLIYFMDKTRNRSREKFWDWLFLWCFTWVIAQGKGIFSGIKSVKDSDLWREFYP